MSAWGYSAKKTEPKSSHKSPRQTQTKRWSSTSRSRKTKKGWGPFQVKGASRDKTTKWNGWFQSRSWFRKKKKSSKRCSWYKLMKFDYRSWIRCYTGPVLNFLILILALNKRIYINYIKQCPWDWGMHTAMFSGKEELHSHLTLKCSRKLIGRKRENVNNFWSWVKD